MKQETNNEVDLLLRRLGRRDETTVSDADHLDTDELSAYAENALPTAARARYTNHLAECASCRSLVVQLSSFAGVVAATESAAVTEPSGFRKFLAGLFTPMVLRYAAPALGLIVIGVIGFVVLRREQAPKYVAQDTTAPQQPVVTATAEPVQGVADDRSNTTASPEKPVERREKNQPAQPAPPPNTSPVVSSVEADSLKDKAASQSKPDQQPVAANEPPPAKPAPTATTEQRPGSPDVSKREVKEFPAAAPAAQTTLQSAEREDRQTDKVARARKPADSASPQGGASVGSIQLYKSADTRTVAGRHFRKERGVWIDTAYDSSKDVMTLARGSEHYRALVADEPEIKTIADILDGEIIVVWKGHTYRIR